MADPRLYRSEYYVWLEAGQEEQILTTAELLDKLKATLSQHAEDLPPDVQQLSGLDQQAHYLLDSACELSVGRGEFFQWYMVRLEK
jgi:hypothetical protein